MIEFRKAENTFQRLSLFLFNVFLFCLLMASPAYWIRGVFTWFPVLILDLYGHQIVIGVLAFLPVVIGCCWLLSIRAKFINRTWFWGNPGITLPLLGITILVLGSLLTDSLSIKFTLRWLENLILLWFVYLFVLNERPNPSLPIAGACLLQGSIALGQFLNQSDLGLRFLGEKILDPETSGIIVGIVDGDRWLRGYGLTGHPNNVATLLALCLLFILPQLIRQTGWRKFGIAVVFGIGFMGLLATFSRGALLGFVGGIFMLVWTSFSQVQTLKGDGLKHMIKKGVPLGGVYLVMALGFLLVNKSFIASRTLDIGVNTLETHSIEARLTSVRVALELIRHNPLGGIGLDHFRQVATEISPGVETVTSIPLLISTELGLFGGFFWLWLAVSPFLLARSAASGAVKWNFHQKIQIASWIAAWVAMQIITQFQLQFWLGRHLYVPVIMGLLCASVTPPYFQRVRGLL